jgi:motility quorum-sensing regulator/GCU-specific mRNA interferase toxin
VYFVMTEKRKPTYDLRAFKAAFATVDRLNATTAALRGAAALGFSRDGIVATIRTMERGQGERRWIIQSVRKRARG